MTAMPALTLTDVMPRGRSLCRDLGIFSLQVQVFILGFRLMLRTAVSFDPSHDATKSTN